MSTFVPTSNWPPCGVAYDLLGPIPLGTRQAAAIVARGAATGIQKLYEIQLDGTTVTRYVDNPPSPIVSNDRLVVDDAVDPDSEPDVYVTPTLNTLGGVTYAVVLAQ